MKIYHKFACVYCGQHLECAPGFCGCQIRCPQCQHRIVIPLTSAQQATGHQVASNGTGDIAVPVPTVITPTRSGESGLNNGIGNTPALL